MPNLYKAQGEGVPYLCLEAEEAAPSFTGRFFEQEARAFYEREAAIIFFAFIKSLPGGTIDALLVRLLDHKRSLWRVTHDQPVHGLPVVVSEREHVGE